MHACMLRRPPPCPLCPTPACHPNPHPRPPFFAGCSNPSPRCCLMLWAACRPTSRPSAPWLACALGRRMRRAGPGATTLLGSWARWRRTKTTSCGPTRQELFLFGPRRRPKLGAPCCAPAPRPSAPPRPAVAGQLAAPPSRCYRLTKPLPWPAPPTLGSPAPAARRCCTATACCSTCATAGMWPSSWLSRRGAAFV